MAKRVDYHEITLLCGEYLDHPELRLREDTAPCEHDPDHDLNFTLTGHFRFNQLPSAGGRHPDLIILHVCFFKDGTAHAVEVAPQMHMSARQRDLLPKERAPRVKRFRSWNAGGIYAIKFLQELEENRRKDSLAWTALLGRTFGKPPSAGSRMKRYRVSGDERRLAADR